MRNSIYILSVLCIIVYRLNGPHCGHVIVNSKIRLNPNLSQPTEIVYRRAAESNKKSKGILGENREYRMATTVKNTRKCLQPHATPICERQYIVIFVLMCLHRTRARTNRKKKKEQDPNWPRRIVQACTHTHAAN